MLPSTRWSLLLGGTVSAGALYLAFRNVPLGMLWRYLGAVDYRFLFLALVLVGLVLAAKALRWQVILGATRRVAFMQAFHPMIIGFMLNCILPGRLGELARPALLRQQSQVPFATGLGTVLAERILDMLTLLALFAWVLANLDLDHGKAVTLGGHQLDGPVILAAGRATLYLALMAVAAVVLFTREPVRRHAVNIIRRLVDAIPGLSALRRQWIETRIVLPLGIGLDHLASGLVLTRRPWRLLGCIGLSVLIWLLTVCSYHVLTLGFPGLQLHLAQTGAMMVVICFCIALPSVPGWWGLWEAGGVFALSFFGVAAGPALAFTLVNHAAQVFPVILVGLVSMLISGLRLGAIGKLSRRFQGKLD